MKDFYALLGLEPSSGGADIKRAYRAKAKLAHPDLAPGQGGSDGGMRELNEAYETLRDPARRREYDALHRALFAKYSFDYRSFLGERRAEPEFESKLLFYDILHGFEDEALECHESLAAKGIPLGRFMDREDAMDIGFLLAEEYGRRGRPLEAFGLYMDAARMEGERAYFRHFYEELLARLRELVRVGLDRGVPGPDRLRCYEEFALLGPAGRDAALGFRKMAELYASNGMRDEAVSYAGRAHELDPGQAGLSRLLRRLGTV